MQDAVKQRGLWLETEDGSVFGVSVKRGSGGPARARIMWGRVSKGREG